MPVRISALLLLAAIQVLDAGVTMAQRQAIDKAIGVSGTYNTQEDTYRVTFPRNDVKVQVDGTPMHPFMGLTSWAAFTSGPADKLIVMGDLVLFEDEVNVAMSAALDAGLQVTALHNHFFFDSPRVMFMHIGGAGAPEVLAAGVSKALSAVREIRKVSAEPTRQFSGNPVPPVSSIAAQGLDGILRTSGQVNGGMYKASFGRKVSMHGVAAGNQMGVNTWAAFFGSMSQAFVDGDFACTEPELQTVLKGLRRRGINIVAIHNHMSDEEPQLIFLHYWGKGRALQLAVALRSVLDEQAGVRPGAAKH